jgi:hypothetical protein
MFILSGIFALTNGNTISGAAVQDGGTATVPAAGHYIRYTGDNIYAANAGLSDISISQDLVTYLYNTNSSFVAFITALLAAGLAGSANVPTADSTVRDSTWQFSAHMPSGEYLMVLGSSNGEPPTIRSNNVSAAIALLEADVDFMGMIAGVVS